MMCETASNIYSAIARCPHEYITQAGVCAGCGSTYTNLNQGGRSKGLPVIGKVNDRNILGDLIKYNFPDDIKHGANEIFHKIGSPTKRNNERNKMLFFLVYTAYREKGVVVNPKVLGKKMSLTTGDVNRALTAYSEVQTGYRPIMGKASPVDALSGLCIDLELDHITSDVIELAKEILIKCPSLNEEFPHKVAAGILSYFMEYNGIKIPMEIFKKSVDFSDVTIKDIHQRITRAHNE